MSKTVKQLAEEIGVSKQAIHQKRKSKALSTALQPFTSTVDGVVYIDVDGEKLLKQAFADMDCKHVDDNEVTTDCKQDTLLEALQGVITTLQEQLKEKDIQLAKQLDMYKEQLAIKDSQIQQLNDRLADSQKILNQEQVLHAGTLQKQLTAPKRSFWPWKKQSEERMRTTDDTESVSNN